MWIKFLQFSLAKTKLSRWFVLHYPAPLSKITWHMQLCGAGGQLAPITVFQLQVCSSNWMFFASVERGSTETTRLQHGSSVFGDTHATGGSSDLIPFDHRVVHHLYWLEGHHVTFLQWTLYSLPPPPHLLPHWRHYACVCVCVFVCWCVYVVWMCITMKKSARRMANTTSDTGDTSSKQQQAQLTQKKITTRERDPFHQSITAILTEEKREEKQFTKPTHVAVYMFRDLNRVCVCVCTRAWDKWTELITK